MSCLIFKLANVTSEEAEEVRQLLADNNIVIYETDSGLFGTSVAGYWLEDVKQKPAAKALLADYAEQRQQRVRAEYLAQQQRGEAETLWQRFKSQPLKLILAFVVIVFILLISTIPFFGV